MWLAGRGYTASVRYSATAAYPVRVPQRLKVNLTWWVMDTCILHRLAAMVQVTLDGIGEWEKGAPGSRSTQRLRQPCSRYISRAVTTMTA